jgi:glycosyltransferase involved in cell wall biosynthesis
MSTQRLSGLIITYNEERHIRDCIRSLQRVCDDVVVVDSLSTDRTAEFARAEGATVVEQAFLGDGPQRTFGLPHCRHDWIVNLDADERLEDDLVDYLLRHDLDAEGHDAYETRRRNHIGMRASPYGGQYPDHVCRIFHRARASFPPVLAHTRIEAADICRLDAHITHYSFRDYPDIFRRALQYPVKMGEELAASDRHISALAPFVHGSGAFIKHYIGKRGFLAGLDGLTLSLGKGLGSYLKYARALEVRRHGRL